MNLIFCADIQYFSPIFPFYVRKIQIFFRQTWILIIKIGVLILFLPLSRRHQFAIQPFSVPLHLLFPQGPFQRNKPVQGRWNQPSICCQDQPLQGRAETSGAERIPAAEEASSPPPGAAARCLHHLPLPGVSGGTLSGQGAALQSGSEVQKGLRNTQQGPDCLFVCVCTPTDNI